MKTRLLFLLTFICLIFGRALTFAEDLDETRAKAEQGNAEAQCSLGFRYANGRDVTKEYAEAVKWFRNSADQRNGLDKPEKAVHFNFWGGEIFDVIEDV